MKDANHATASFVLACSCGQTFHGDSDERWAMRVWHLVHAGPGHSVVTAVKAMVVREMALGAKKKVPS